jgi:hypothetical protein
MSVGGLCEKETVCGGGGGGAGGQISYNRGDVGILIEVKNEYVLNIKIQSVPRRKHTPSLL